MLPTIASLIDEGLRDGREHYATLLEARPRRYVLDDATIERTKRVNAEGLEWCDVYDRQLLRWRSQQLSDEQRREIARLEDVQRDLRLVLIGVGAWLLLSFVTFAISAQIQKGKLDEGAKAATAKAESAKPEAAKVG